MTLVCYLACGLALLTALLVLLTRTAMHALLYLVLMLLALALVFFTLGAPFAAALEILVYAGAIMVLFVFVIMMLNVGSEDLRVQHRRLSPLAWALPLLLAAALFTLVAWALSHLPGPPLAAGYVGPKAVGVALYRPYLLGVELVSLLLLAGLVAAFHLAPRPRSDRARREEEGEEVESVHAR